MELTRDNYYTLEADREYMSCSQYQSFLECEASTMAYLNGKYKGRSDSEAFLVGNYVHSFLESEEAHKQFLDEHFDDIYKTSMDKKTGIVTIKGKYAPFERADVMIKTLTEDEQIKRFIEMPGENEKIMTGTLFGMPWKIRLDKYIPDRRLIIDYKTVADLYRTEYNPETKERESFVEAYGYVMRASVYSEIERQNTPCKSGIHFVLICVTKQEIPDKEMLLLDNPERYEFELDIVKKNMQRIYKVKTGMAKPLRCGKCEYCRSTKKLKGLKPYYTLTPGFAEELEEDYAYDTERTAMEVSQVQDK